MRDADDNLNFSSEFLFYFIFSLVSWEKMSEMPNQFCNLSVSLVWPEMLKAADKLRLGLHDSQFIFISSWTFMQLLRSFCIELVFQSFNCDLLEVHLDGAGWRF